jgi:hypothetical protein
MQEENVETAIPEKEKPFTKKIDDKLFIKMIKAQTPMQKIADHFGVSPTACYYKRDRMKKKGTLKIPTALSVQQQEFVELVEHKVAPIEAIKAVYAPNPGTEKMALQRVMSQPAVKEAIGSLLDAAKLTRQHLATRLREHVDSPKDEISLRATIEGFKLHDDYPAQKNINIAVNLDWLTVDLEAFALPVPGRPVESPVVEAELVATSNEVQETSNEV